MHGSVSRMAGADRYTTAVALSKATFADDSVGTVYVATGRSFPDGLSAGPVAGVRGGPLLLVPGTSLPSAVAASFDASIRPASCSSVGRGWSATRSATRSAPSGHNLYVANVGADVIR